MVPDGQDLQRFSFKITITHSFNKHARSAYSSSPVLVLGLEHLISPDLSMNPS